MIKKKMRELSSGVKAPFDSSLIYCLVDYLIKQDKLLKLMIPNEKKFSSLYRKVMSHIVFMNNLKEKLEYRKAPK